MNLVAFIAVISFCCTAAVITGKLTLSAALIGAVLSLAIFLGIGWTGIALLAAFFLLGTTATSWGRAAKEQLGIAQEQKGRRNAGQVIANGGVAGLLGIVAILLPEYRSLISLMMAASFSSATADTLSSELGSIYGKNFYDILSLKNGIRGADGVVSSEGFLLGIGGSLIIALIYIVFKGWSAAFYFIIITGTLGNLADSLLGATLERKDILKNDAVNFLNTVIAALFMLLCLLL